MVGMNNFCKVANSWGSSCEMRGSLLILDLGILYISTGPYYSLNFSSDRSFASGYGYGQHFSPNDLEVVETTLSSLIACGSS